MHPPEIREEKTIAAYGVKLETLLLALQIVALFFTRFFQPAAFTDDAYIHFRFAANFARGDGLVFEPGQWVLGTTSPVYALILGIGHWATRIDLPLLAALVNLGCDAGIAILALMILKGARIPLLWRHAIVLLLTFEPVRMFNSATGMEMSLFILAILAVLRLAEANRWLACGILLGTVGWIRPEGAVLWLALAVGLAVTKQRRTLLRTFGVGLATASMITMGTWLRYGNFIPQSIITKSVAPWYIAWQENCALEFILALQRLSPFYIFTLFSDGTDSIWRALVRIVMVLTQVVLMLYGARALWQRGARFNVVTLGAFFVGYYVFFALGRPQIFSWYFTAYFFVSLLMGGVGAYSILSGFARRYAGKYISIRRAEYADRLLAVMMLVLWMLGLSGSARVEGYFDGQTLARSLTFRFLEASPLDRHLAYIRAADTFNRFLGGDSQAKVACIEIGVFGYYFKGSILDVYGLVSPEVLDVTKAEVYETLEESSRVHPWNVFLIHRPEYIMGAHLFLQNEPPGFDQAYTEVHVPESYLRIYVRNDVLESLAGKAVPWVSRRSRSRG
ncbi:hypothetical protein IIC65_04335 [Candidatus Sumerlaeota bacterium]|nr:hypothetical protein [Candidatus Sumerlaeota bacterium]